MFRRKDTDGDAPRQEGVSASEGQPSVKPFTRPMGVEPPKAGPTPAAGPAKPAVPTPPTASVMRPDAPRKAADIPNAARRPEPPKAPSSSGSEAKRLIVGRDIILNGQITACERLVVEGRVEAALNDCRTIEVLDSGTFKGSAEVESAEISGRVEGNLTVRERLLIRSTGQVNGTVRYGRIEIEMGGEVNGDVRSLATPHASVEAMASHAETRQPATSDA